MNAFRFAHLSDPHLPMVPENPPLAQLASKRALGFLSWRRRRRHIHRPEILARLMADMAAHAPAHLVCTGDLTNIALPEEFAAAAAWLAGQGNPRDVTVIPGNHDALVPVPPDRGLGLWAPWLRGDSDGDDGCPVFPFVRRRGPVAFVGLSSAVPTAPLLATGRVGARQLAAAEERLTALGAEGLFRVLLLHHPVAEGALARRKALDDRAAVRALVRRAGAELVLHGHAHVFQFACLPGPAGPVACLTLPSASAVAARHGDAAQWAMFGIEPQPAGWAVEVTLRGLRDRDGGFATLARWRLTVPTQEVRTQWRRLTRSRLSPARASNRTSSSFGRFSRGVASLEKP